MMPQTKYAKSGNVHIAYPVVGTGPIDIVLVHRWVSNIEEIWEERTHARFVRRLASFSRLILFDKRGTGLSDRVDGKALPTLEQRINDVRASPFRLQFSFQTDLNFPPGSYASTA